MAVLVLMLVSIADPIMMLVGFTCGFFAPPGWRGYVAAVAVDMLFLALIRTLLRTGGIDPMMELVQVPIAAIVHVGVTFAVRSATR